MGRQIGGFPKITTFLGELRNSSNHFVFVMYKVFPGSKLSFWCECHVISPLFFTSPQNSNSWPQLKVDPFLFGVVLPIFRSKVLVFGVRLLPGHKSMAKQLVIPTCSIDLSRITTYDDGIKAFHCFPGLATEMRFGFLRLQKVAKTATNVGCVKIGFFPSHNWDISQEIRNTF